MQVKLEVGSEECDPASGLTDYLVCGDGAGAHGGSCPDALLKWKERSEERKDNISPGTYVLWLLKPRVRPHDLDRGRRWKFQFSRISMSCS